MASIMEARPIPQADSAGAGSSSSGGGDRRTRRLQERERKAKAEFHCKVYCYVRLFAKKFIQKTQFLFLFHLKLSNPDDESRAESCENCFDDCDTLGTSTSADEETGAALAQCADDFLSDTYQECKEMLADGINDKLD